MAEPRAFAAWLRVLFRHDWVVYSKRPFGGPEHVLRYLGAYTHRVAISNRRLVALSEGNVTFQWRDSAHGNKKRLMTLDVEEFLRRFLLHLLPRGFVRIRNFGFLANRQRAILLPLCFQLLHGSENITASPASPPADQPQSLWNCPVCGGTMHVVERLTAAQLLLRSPPASCARRNTNEFRQRQPVPWMRNTSALTDRGGVRGRAAERRRYCLVRDPGEQRPHYPRYAALNRNGLVC